jgi:RNA-directed DNA polymerase
MKESYGKGLATHTDPESCGAACEGGVEALTGARAGRVFSRESSSLRGADAVRRSGRLHLARRYRETRRDPARSETPSTYSSTSHENREIPWSPVAADATGRVGKSIDARRR